MRHRTISNERPSRRRPHGLLVLPVVVAVAIGACGDGGNGSPPDPNGPDSGADADRGSVPADASNAGRDSTTGAGADSAGGGGVKDGGGVMADSGLDAGSAPDSNAPNGGRGDGGVKDSGGVMADSGLDAGSAPDSNAADSGSSADAGTSCGFTPVTPNATAATRKVLCYLHSIYGNHILSGQEEDNNDNGMNTIFAATGKYPAIRAFDVNNSMAPTQCVTHWNNGGLCMFGYHMGINGGTYNTPTNISNVLTAGTAENTSFKQDLDRIYSFVQPLQQAGGVAILRLFHEAGNNCNWFWWSMGSSSQWQQLFKYAFNYLTATKGLDNVLWIAPLCGSPNSSYDPGPQYIDLGGADTYQAAGDYEPLTNLFQQTQNAFPNMMVALHECGPIPDPAQLQASSTKWLFFNVWASPYFTPQFNPADHLKAVYTSDYVITRDELPSFK